MVRTTETLYVDKWGRGQERRAHHRVDEVSHEGKDLLVVKEFTTYVVIDQVDELEVNGRGNRVCQTSSEAWSATLLSCRSLQL